MSIENYNFMTIVAPLGISISIVAAFVLSIMFIGTKKKNKWENSRFGSFLYDTINFKTLLIDKIMKVLYILSNCICIFGGVCLFFYSIYIVISEGFWAPLGISLLMIIVGPIALRIVYELMMMGIMLVQNVVEINRKLDR